MSAGEGESGSASNATGQVIQQGKPSGPPHEGSRETYDGIITSVPKDYCWTPAGSGYVLIGYKITAKQREATNLANSVLQTSLRSHVKGSIINRCEGDEKGTGGGFFTHKHNAECTPKTWSETVTFEGRNAVRDSDEWWMNHKNTWGVLDYKKDTNQYPTDDPRQVDARLFMASSTTTAPGTTTGIPGAAPNNLPATTGGGGLPSGTGSGSGLGGSGSPLGGLNDKLDKLQQLYDVGQAGHDSGVAAGQYVLPDQDKIANQIVSSQVPLTQDPYAASFIGSNMPGAPVPAANYILSLKTGQAVDITKTPPDKLKDIINKPMPSLDQLRKNAEALKKNAVRQTGNCRKQLICFTNSKGLDLSAYQEQLKMQQNGINKKSACQNVADIDKFDSQPNKDAYRATGDDEKEKTINAYKASHPGADMSNLNALHEIDMVAGGNPKIFGGVGNSNVNQAIGGSWNQKNRKKDLYDYAKQMCAAKCKMAVTLSICSYTTPSRGVGA